MKSREEMIHILKTRPYKIGHSLGFKDLNKINNEWIVDMITAKVDKTLQAHRGSYKTTCLSIAMPILMVLFPNKRILFQRKTDTAVKEVISQVRKILLSKEFQLIVKSLYGKDAYIELTKDSATELTTNLTTDIKGTSQLVGIGTKSSITGKHFDIIFTDDIVTLEDRESRAERERICRIYAELHNIKNRGGRIYNTGTPWHPDDAFKEMPKPTKYDWKSTGLISEEYADYLRETMIKSLFAANYELRHVASDDVIFSNPQTGADFELCKNGISHTDAAFYGEDWTAFTVANTHNGKIYIFGKTWRKHVDDVKEEIVNWHKATLSGIMHVEKNADKGYVAKEFKKMGVRTNPYDESQNKFIKITSYLKFNWKDVIFVEGTDEEYIKQICDYNEKASHDDCPDSLASIIRILKPKLDRKPYKPIIY